MKYKQIPDVVVELQGIQEPVGQTLADRIRELPATPVPKATALDIAKSSKKKKKKEKKKKNSESSSELFPDGRPGESSDDAEGMGNYKDINDIIDELVDEELNEDEDFADGIIIRQKEGYDDRKKNADEYKKEFNEELTLLYSELEDLNKLSKLAEKQWKSIESSRARGSSKYTNDLLSNVVSLKTNKLHVIKEIVNVKKVTADLQLKKDSKEGNNNGGGGVSMDDVSALYLNQIMTGGRANFIDALGGSVMNNEVDEFEMIANELDQEESGQFNDRYDNLNQAIMSRLEEEGNPDRDDVGTSYILHEHQNCKVEVKRNIETNEWKFIAIDENGMEVPTYPVPNRYEVGKMTFTDTYAKDGVGRMYKLNEVYADMY